MTHAVLGWIILAFAVLGILANSRMTEKRPSTLLAFGNALFFIGPILWGVHLLVTNAKQLDAYGFGFALVGLIVMGIGLTAGRRRS